MIPGNKLNIHLSYVTTNQKNETLNIRKYETPRDKLHQKHVQDLNGKFKMLMGDANKKYLNK